MFECCDSLGLCAMDDLFVWCLTAHQSFRLLVSCAMDEVQGTEWVIEWKEMVSEDEREDV